MAPVIAGFRGPPGTLSIVDAEAYESEADGPMASLTFPVRLSGVAPAGGVWFGALVADGTARAGVDYVVPTQVEYSLTEGTREARGTDELIRGTVEEAAETTRVALANVHGATVTDGEGLGKAATTHPPHKQRRNAAWGTTGE